jgi:hypothetical protein
VAVPQTHAPGAEAEVDFGEFYAMWSAAVFDPALPARSIPASASLVLSK